MECERDKIERDLENEQRLRLEEMRDLGEKVRAQMVWQEELVKKNSESTSNGGDSTSNATRLISLRKAIAQKESEINGYRNQVVEDLNNLQGEIGELQRNQEERILINQYA